MLRETGNPEKMAGKFNAHIRLRKRIAIRLIEDSEVVDVLNVVGDCWGFHQTRFQTLRGPLHRQIERFAQICPQRIIESSTTFLFRCPVII